MNTKNFTVFLLECLAGTIIGFLIYRNYPVIGAWSLFSIILVLAPDKKDAVSLALNRVKANLIGALIALMISIFHPISLPILCLGVALSMLLCKWLNLEAVTKSAIVAIMIIAMHVPGQNFYEIALERAFGVLLGCLIGVMVTWAFHYLSIYTGWIVGKVKKES